MEIQYVEELNLKCSLMDPSAIAGACFINVRFYSAILWMDATALPDLFVDILFTGTTYVS